MTALVIILGSSLLWLAIATPFAVLTGRVIKAGDATEPDLLADIPVECLSDEEIRLRCERLEVWL